MSAQPKLWRLEQRLRDQLARDAAHPSRCRREGDMIIVTPSGTACGLAIAIGARTGEEPEAIYERVTR